MVEPQSRDVPLTFQADLLGLNRTGLYYQPRPPSAEEIAIKHRIDEIYTAQPFYCSRRITVILNQAGPPNNRKAVQRHMREMCIAGICPGPNLSKRNAAHAIYPYLLRNLTICHPTRCGVLTSPISAWRGAGCTWWQCWTCSRATCLVGNSTSD